jgi:hypothetical protein
MTVTNHKVAAVVTPSTPSAQDGAAADESHARENPQRQAHQTHRHEGILGLAGNAQQEIHLDHRDRGGEADQKRGAQARRPAMLVAVQADQGTRNERQSQAFCNFRPLQYEGHFQRDHPRLMAALFLITLRDRAILNGWLINVGRRPAFIRVIHLLLELTQRLQLRGLAAGPHIPLPLTQQDIADSTGLTTSYVNRILQDLRQRGLVHLRDHILEILRPEELARLAGFKPDYLQFSPQMWNPLSPVASLGDIAAPYDLRSRA